MQLRYDQLANHLQKNLASLYLLSSDVPLLLQEARDAIRNKAEQQGYADRQVFQVETGFSWPQLLGTAANLSLFATKQILELRFLPGQLGETGSKALRAYADKIPNDKILIISTSKLDANQQKSTWLKAIEKTGVYIQIWPISIEQLPQWLAQRMAKVGLQADQEGMQILAGLTEGNLLSATQEIEKLRLLYGPGALTAPQIAKAVMNNARFDIFQLADMTLSGNSKQALHILTGLKSEGIEPILILWALARELRTLASAAHCIEQGASVEQTLQKLYVWEKRKPILRSALSRHQSTTFHRLIQQTSTIDRVLKGLESGNIWDELEKLILAII